MISGQFYLCLIVLLRCVLLSLDFAEELKSQEDIAIASSIEAAKTCCLYFEIRYAHARLSDADGDL